MSQVSEKIYQQAGEAAELAVIGYFGDVTANPENVGWGHDLDIRYGGPNNDYDPKFLQSLDGKYQMVARYPDPDEAEPENYRGGRFVAMRDESGRLLIGVSGLSASGEHDGSGGKFSVLDDLGDILAIKLNLGVPGQLDELRQFVERVHNQHGSIDHIAGHSLGGSLVTMLAAGREPHLSDTQFTALDSSGITAEMAHALANHWEVAPVEITARLFNLDGKSNQITIAMREPDMISGIFSVGAYAGQVFSVDAESHDKDYLLQGLVKKALFVQSVLIFVMLQPMAGCQMKNRGN